MSYASNRIFAMNFDGIYGESDQDANSALTELDKGLRSLKVGEQCEAIVRFPKLFEKYPFPILINSAFLKLADVFRLGNNFLRLWVFKVTQQSEKHLDKILNVDEYVKRLYTVIYSNDPLARTLTLRTLGSIASIIPERKNVHHSIRDSFDSHDSVELEAAIYAADKFSKYSKDFAGSICTKIEEMIQKLSTPVEMKLKLIPILQNMHHDASTSATVRKLCTHLLDNYPAEQFIMVTVHTLTHLAASTMVDIPDQVALLVEYLQDDARNSIKGFILKELKTLAIKGGHLWNTNLIASVIMFAWHVVSPDLQCKSLQVLACLAKSSQAALKFIDLCQSGDNANVLQLCQQCSYSDNLHVASHSIHLYTLICIHQFQAMGTADDQVLYDVSTSIECILIVICSLDNMDAQQIVAMKRCLKCTVQLCHANTQLCHRFIDALGDLSISATGAAKLSLLEALCAIGNIQSGVIKCILPQLIEQIGELQQPQKQHSRVIASLCTLVFQAVKDVKWLPKDQTLITDVAKSSSLWDAYKIARQAARYGHHAIATHIFSHLTTKVSLENHHFWMVSLSEICKAETFLDHMKDPSGRRPDSAAFMDNISVAVVHYMKGISALKATTSPAHQMDIQCEFMKLRCEMLKSYIFLMQACNTLRSCPPPAIAVSIAMSARDDLQKCGRVVVQLRKASNDFHKISNKYREFSQALFNADPVTLNILQILQFDCLLTAHAIACVALRQTNFPFSQPTSIHDELQSHNLEVQSMCNAAVSATHLVNQFLQSNIESENVCHKQTDILFNVMYELLKVPMSLPRYYFQSLQSTSIKLAISPEQRGSDPLPIQNSCNLAVKVEGVIQHNSKAATFRQVSQIQLSISSAVQSRTPSNIDTKVTGDATNNMKQTVTPHNEYFSAQFLLAFPVAGVHSVTINTSLIDTDNNLWNTGPQSTLCVKSFEDPSVAMKNNQVAATTAAPRQNFAHRF